MITQLKCSQGHSWDPAAMSSAPLVCPTCGRPPLTRAAQVEHLDPEQTVDHNNDATIDSPPPSPVSRFNSSSAAPAPPASEVTQTMHFTPIPRPPSNSSSSPAPNESSQQSLGRALSSSNSGKMDPSLFPSSMPFTIIRQHARGGLGLVNLARDEFIKREVALKQILPQHADNETLKKRFLYEAQITGQLEHPSIVPVYTLGSDATSNPYYVMRFVRGRTLDNHITEYHSFPNPIVFRELLRRFIAICQALAYAHSRGVIHRDLKPSNIMLGDYGETLVLDWGLAKDIKNKTDPALFDETPSTPSPAPTSPRPTEASHAGTRHPTTVTNTNTAELTMQGQIIGTPAYMAPEQAEGRTELHAPVTDIYALGGILYKILVGQSPTAPTASATAVDGSRRLTFVPSQPPSKINKDVNPLLEQICMRAMATEPAARYPRALELAQDIQRWLDEHPLSLRPPSRTAKLTAFLRANLIPILIVIIGLIAILITLMIVDHPT